MFTTTVVWKYFKNIWKHWLRKWKHEAGRLVQLRYVRVQIMIICQQLNDIVHVQVWGTYCCIHKCMIELLWVAEKKSPTLFSVKWFASTCLNFTTHKCMVNRMFNAIHEQSPACLKCPNMHKFAHIECASLYDNAQIRRLSCVECASLYDNAQIRRLSCVDSWVTQVTHEITWTNPLIMNRLIQNHANPCNPCIEKHTNK